MWLVQRDDLGKDEVWVKLDQRRVSPGTKVTVRAGARTSAGDPLSTAAMEAVVIHSGGERERVALERDPSSAPNCLVDRPMQGGRVELVSTE